MQTWWSPQQPKRSQSFEIMYSKVRSIWESHFEHLLCFRTSLMIALEQIIQQTPHFTLFWPLVKKRGNQREHVDGRRINWRQWLQRAPYQRSRVHTCANSYTKEPEPLELRHFILCLFFLLLTIILSLIDQIRSDTNDCPHVSHAKKCA